MSNRAIIEQVNGVLAEHGEIAVNDAFRRLRVYTCDTNPVRAQVASDVADRCPDPNLILAERPAWGFQTRPEAT